MAAGLGLRRPVSSDEVEAARMDHALGYLIYRSVALIGEAGPEMTAILETSRVRNVAWNISGFVMRDTNTFLQYIEGPTERVERLFEIIRVDPRHEGVTVVSRGRLEHRQCRDWPMAILTPSDRFMAFHRDGYKVEGYALDLPYNPFLAPNLLAARRFRGMGPAPSDPRLNRRERSFGDI